MGGTKTFRYKMQDPALAYTTNIPAKTQHYLSNFPIKTPDDIKKLTPRTFSIDRKVSLDYKKRLEDAFGDILPVKLGNFDNFDFDLGNQPFTGNNFIGVTWDLFKLIGAESM